MFGVMNNPANAYARVGVETAVLAGDPHKLILMLFDGAIESVAAATLAMDSRDIPAKGASVSKAIEIIANGLRVSLDLEAGGKLAEQLSALYGYMVDRLLYANIHGNRAALDEVSGLLRELRSAWAEIGSRVEAAA